MFKNHPNKANIKFVVLPIIREVLASTNDIGRNIHEIAELYGKDKELTQGVHLDFSLVMNFSQPELYQIHTLANFEKQQYLLSQLKEQENHVSNYLEVMTTTLINNFPRYESHQDIYKRTEIIKNFMRQYLK
mmetsp:Transcript_44595/g.43242  ORF Transcript_44595/g.43242 Transcript_44595/m.43242 type:complete len:132 (+) Transcript_44595:246-641(+)